MDYFYNLAKKLKELREQYGYTQNQVAEKLNVTYQSYQAYEYGRAIPSLEHYLILADLYDVPMDELVGRK